MEAKKRKSLKISEALHWRVKSAAAACCVSVEVFVESALNAALPSEQQKPKKK
jgi:predicted HicB family RNase H-like nuclease